MLECIGDRGVGPHRVAGQHDGPLADLRGDHGIEVRDHLGVRVAAGLGGRIGAPVSPGVVGELAIAAPREDLGPMDDVAPGRCHPVKEDDRCSLPERLPGEAMPVQLDRELR